jgi:hypothetical protein
MRSAWPFGRAAFSRVAGTSPIPGVRAWPLMTLRAAPATLASGGCTGRFLRGKPAVCITPGLPRGRNTHKGVVLSAIPVEESQCTGEKLRAPWV